MFRSIITLFLVLGLFSLSAAQSDLNKNQRLCVKKKLYRIYLKLSPKDDSIEKKQKCVNCSFIEQVTYNCYLARYKYFKKDSVSAKKILAEQTEILSKVKENKGYALAEVAISYYQIGDPQAAEKLLSSYKNTDQDNAVVPVVSYFAGQGNISLVDKYIKQVPDQDVPRVYAELGLYFHSVGDQEKFKVYTDNAYKMAINSNNVLSILETVIGFRDIDKLKDKSTTLFDKSIDIFSKINPAFINPEISSYLFTELVFFGNDNQVKRGNDKFREIIKELSSINKETLDEKKLLENCSFDTSILSYCMDQNQENLNAIRHKYDKEKGSHLLVLVDSYFARRGKLTVKEIADINKKITGDEHRDKIEWCFFEAAIGNRDYATALDLIKMGKNKELSKSNFLQLIKLAIADASFPEDVKVLMIEYAKSNNYI